MLKSLALIDDIIEGAKASDKKYNPQAFGESWTVFHLRKLKELLVEENQEVVRKAILDLE